ncbi:MAG: vitamin B12 dependent-methionine synthase activation domain-containing protein [Tissierellaceae bacterium]|nr:vitamin B12 dependent-methionine synthase activation domain-containing protein [Tissierellaceae bacterium]
MAKISINKDEVLRYLGYKNQVLDGITNRLIDESIREISNSIDEKYTYKFFDITRGKGKLWIKGTNLRLIGEDIKNHLKNSDICIFMAVTLGHDIDTMIRYYEKISMSKAMILDACASAAIEEICDAVNYELENMVSKDGKTLTSRYSSGYGDLPIDMQNELLEILEAKKSIGLSVTSHNILIPRKSVTAILGVIDEKHKKEAVSCNNCNKYDSCNYRKGDVGCGS